MNIISFENTFIFRKQYIPKLISNKTFSGITNNADCLVMNAKEKKNIFTCFYGGTYPIQISVSSFSLENNEMTELISYSTQMKFIDNEYINFFKAKSIGNKSTALICFYIQSSHGYTAVYNINLNNLSSVQKISDFVGTSIRCINLEYFERTEQFVLSFRDNEKSFTVVMMNKTYDIIFNENGQKNYFFYLNFLNRESIIYLKEKNEYYFLFDGSNDNKNRFTTIYSLNITSIAKNNFTEYNDEDNDAFNQFESDSIQEMNDTEKDSKQKENEVKENEEEKQGNIKESIKEEININKEEKSETSQKENLEEKNEEEENKEGKEKNIEEKLKSENKEEREKQEIENKEDKNNKIFEEKSDITYNSENIKCLDFNEESLKMNLCLECNTYLGYYPVDFKSYNILPNNFKECFNDDTKLINFYFNKEKKQYEPCFETCNTCNYGGNEEINNCTSCDIDSIFRPEEINTTNCVKKCKYKYYINKYGQYKCVKNNQCPEEAYLFIPNKNKCIENCKLDNIYKYQYNGECLDKCPIGTIEDNYICKIVNINKCSFIENRNVLKDYLSSDEIDLLAKIYAKEYIYTNKHILIYKHDMYSITIYKEKNCINELSLTVPQIDFGPCYQKIHSNNLINYNNTIILIVEKYFNGSSIVLYEFYDPINGNKIDVSNECKDINITIEKSLIKILKGIDVNFENIIKMTSQNINIFNKSSEFYNDICFHYESSNGKDIPLKDRLKEYYPNITLCNDDCLCIGINLTSLSSICECKFSNFLKGSNILLDNLFVSKIIDEIGEIFLQSNLLILQCYKDVFVYKYFIKNTGGFIILSLLICQNICIFFFYFIHYKLINRYIFILMETYLFYLNKKQNINYKNDIISFLKDKASPPKKSKNKKNSKNIIFKNNINIIKFNINKIQIKNNNVNEENNNTNNNINSTIKFNSPEIKISKKKNNKKILVLKNLKQKNSSEKLLKNQINDKNKDNYTNTNANKNQIKKFIENYLSTDTDEIDYYNVIKFDNRTFFQYFFEKIKENQFLLDIFLNHEPIKPKTIKILLLLINIDLYFVINGLFINENYISEVHHSDEEWSFFGFVKRSNTNLFYTSMIGALSGYLISFFILEEKRIKHILKRNKDNTFYIKNEIFIIIQDIKNRFMLLFITSNIITIFSWYYISCFNNVYPYIKKEWIVSSICIFIVMQIFYFFCSLIETILRFLSFKIKSEKLFKISRIFS